MKVQLLTLADNSQMVMLTALAQADLLGSVKIGIVNLSTTSNVILIGMAFLRRFNQALVVSQKKGVMLVDEDSLTPR